jgi:class 3 adenylate cyclase/tetratricopeptide (TPR) repeat protein
MPGSADLLASFLPGPLRLRLATRPEMPEGLLAEETDLVAMQMDVSGFSGLTERLAADASMGTEQIVAELNRYFRGLIGAVDRHGGLMVGFGGDSLVAVWIDGISLAEAAIAAGSCALDAQATIAGIGGSTQRSLDFRIGIGAGRAVMLDLGGFRGRRQFLVAGPAVTAMGSAVVDVDPGNVAVTGDVARLLGQSRLVPAASGMFRLLAVEHSPSGVAAMQPVRLERDVSPAIEAYLPAGIGEFLGEDEAGWHTEYLTTTSLFLNMRGLDLIDARDRNALQLVVRTAQETFDRYEGTLTGILADDKALTLLGVFGLPPLVHEEDALRAVEAGQALDRALLDIHLDHGIGITTGRVFTGLYGTDVFRARAVVGPSVNLAARLMQAAGNEVLCDRATRRATRGRVHFAPLAPIRVKGHDTPVEAYRPIWSVLPGTTATDPLVGRDEEREIIHRRLDAAARGEPTILVLEGEAGIGKTRLAGEAIDTSRALDFTVLTGGGHPVEAAPYSAWRSVCGEALGFDTIVDPGERVRVLQQRFAGIPGGPDLSPLLAAVLAIDVPGTSATAALTPEGRRMRTATAVVELLRSLVEAPLLIVMEDCHWLDAASWDLLRAVHQELPEAALLLTTRPAVGERPEVLEELVATSEGRLLRLERIPADAARRLAGDRFGVTELPDRLAGLIEAKAEGHPLFIEELVYSLRDQGYVDVVDGRVATAVPGERLENLDLPDTIHGLTSSRLSRLSAIEQTTVKVASVLGDSFDADLLAAIHPLNLDEHLIAEQLDDLARRDLIRQTETGFAFRHAVVQESAYEQLPLAMRRRLHEEVATRIEQAGPDPTQYPLLAHHWESAGNLEPALDYLEGAGAAALEAGAFDDAASFLSAALSRADQLDVRGTDLPATRCAYLHQSLGEARAGQGRLEPAVEQYQAALAKLGHSASGGWFRASGRFIKEVFVQIGHLLGRRPKPGPQVAVIRQAAFILSVLGQVYYFQADVPGWLVTNLRSINLAERAGDPGVAGPAYAGLGNLAGTVRLHRLARRYFRLGRADPRGPVFEGQPGPLAAKIERDVTTSFQVAADLSEAVYLLAGKADHSAEVIELLDRTVDAAQRIASDAFGAALAVRGFARTIYGPLDLARRDLSELAADGHRRDQPQHETWARTLLVPLLVDAGEVDGAMRSSDAASLVVERADSIALGLHLTTRARTLVAVGRGDEARKTLAEATGVLRPSPIFLHLTAYTAWCDSWATLAAEGDRKALDELKSCLSGMRRYALLLPFARPRLHLFKGIHARMRNRTAAARRHFLRGASYADTGGLIWDSARLHAEAAALFPDGDERRIHLELAAAAESRLGSVSGEEPALAAG